jgi:hypothetical protein
MHINHHAHSLVWINTYMYMKGILYVVAYSVRALKMNAVVITGPALFSDAEYFYWLVVMQDTQMRNTCVLDAGKQNVALFLDACVPY